MPNPEYHLRYLRASLENLEDYLLSSTLFWPSGISAPTGEAPFPHITIGNLLVERAMLSAMMAGAASATAPLADIEAVLERVMSKWRVAWEGKVDAEIPSRLRQWQEWLRDEGADGPPAPGHYRSGIRLRLLLDLLGEQGTKAASNLAAQLPALDSRLRAMVQSGDFVWDEVYQAGFPQDKYWYLYTAL